jgi:hypothetical protein
MTNFKTAGAHSDLDWNERCMRLGFFALSRLSVLSSSVSILFEVAAGTLDRSAVGLSPRPEQV